MFAVCMCTVVLQVMIALMMAMVLLLIGGAFQSVAAPVRAVVCLAWMLVLTFGFAIFVFQNCAKLVVPPTRANRLCIRAGTAPKRPMQPCCCTVGAVALASLREVAAAAERCS